MNLQQWRDTGSYFTFQGHQIFYRVQGEGVPLLLIHGYPTASWDWAKIWQPLTTNFQCITLDMLGFGFSDKPQIAYSIFSQADIYCALLELLDCNDCHIVSHDYGDTVAQELLARHHEHLLPFKINTLHLLNGGLFPETHRPLFIQKLLMSPLGGLLVKLMNKSTLTKNLRKIFGPNSQPSESDIDDFWQLINHNNGQLVLHRLIHYMAERVEHRYRWVTALQKTKVPLRLTNGVLDPISGEHLVQRYYQLINDADVVRVDHAGHYPQFEAPNAVLLSVLSMIEINRK